MPYKKKTYRRKKTGKKKFMGKKLRQKRKEGISTKVFYFKANGEVSSGGTGAALVNFSTQLQRPIPETNAPVAPADWNRIARCYQEYKYLAVKLELFPANVGTESDAPGFSSNPFNRGNAVTYINQSVDRDEQEFNAIDQVINKGSAMMIKPRAKHTRIMYRPKGFPEWGCCDFTVNPSTLRVADPWWARIVLIINNATANIERLWFWRATYKCIFRGRTFISPVPGIVGIGTDPVPTIDDVEDSE